MRGCALPCKVRDVRVAALGLRDFNLQNELIWNKREKQTSLSGEHDSLGRGERAPARAQDIPVVRGMG